MPKKLSLPTFHDFSDILYVRMKKMNKKTQNRACKVVRRVVIFYSIDQLVTHYRRYISSCVSLSKQLHPSARMTRRSLAIEFGIANVSCNSSGQLGNQFFSNLLLSQ